MGLTDHPAHSDRQAGGGDGQKNGVNIVGGVEIAEAHIPDNVLKGNFINGTDDLNNGHRQGKQCRALQEVLLFG